MKTQTLFDFTSLPAGAEAIPPKDSDYARAIHLPLPERDAADWLLIRAETHETEWVSAGYLLGSGWIAADRIGLTFGFEDGPEPGLPPLDVRISVDFTDGMGTYAWAVAAQLGQLVSDNDVLAELLEHDDASAARLVARAHLDDPSLDEAVSRHPSGKGLAPEDDS